MTYFPKHRSARTRDLGVPQGEGSPLPLRAELYYAFSECYKEPWEGFAADVAFGTLYRVLEEAFGALGFSTDLAPLWIHRPVADVLQQLKRAYHRLFVIPPRFALPVESVYKDWSGEGGFLSGARGMIEGPPAADMVLRYRERRILIPKEFAHYPDHLALLLEYGGMLCEEQDMGALKGFVESHLDGWIEEFAADVRKMAPDDFYRAVVEATVMFIQAERRILLFDNGRVESEGGGG